MSNYKLPKYWKEIELNDYLEFEVNKQSEEFNEIVGTFMSSFTTPQLCKSH